MALEEKELLLKDLCPRLPYGVKCSITKKGVVRELKPMNNGISMPVNQVCDVTVKKTLNTDIINDFLNDNIVLKPYLRSMSSMTPDERFEYDELNHFYTKGLTFNIDEIDWLLSHHFDYRGLIEKGLALEAPEGLYKAV